MSLRSRAKHFSLGPPKNLPANQFPANKDFINYVRLLHGQKPNLRSKVLSAEIFKPVAERVFKIWNDEGIPSMQLKGVQRKVAACYSQYKKLNKTKTVDREAKSSASEKARSYFGRLFDIALCRCKDLRHCRCPRERKVPEKEISFLRDQRRSRKMLLGGIDRRESARRKTATSRRLRQRQAEGQLQPGSLAGPSDDSQSGRNEAGQSDTPDVAMGDQSSHDSVDFSSGSQSDSVTVSEDSATVSAGEPLVANCDTLTNTALAADRFGLSNRSVAAVINAFQLDIGRASSKNPTLLLDPKKVWRKRVRVRRTSAEARSDKRHGSALQSLYFDGRKDPHTNTGRSTECSEEHIAVVAEPGGEYVTHFTPSSGRAKDQVQELVDIAAERGGAIRVLGCDGAAVNTGSAGGVCRLFEVLTEHPVHWFVCQLHSNELNLREVFRKYDGKTTGPKSLTGPLGKAVTAEVHALPPVQFNPIAGHVSDLPAAAEAELSADQLLLHRLAVAIQTGHLAEEDARKRIGPVNHARWLTLAARLLRLYVATASPSPQLCDIIKFLVGHYVPVWFHIRKHSECSSGAKNMMFSLELLRTLPQQLQDTVKPVIQRNSYWCHPEAILLAMVTDQDPELRTRAVQVIQQCRQQPQGEVRPFVLPAVNFNAVNFTEMLDWNAALLTEPPLTMDLNDSELDGIRVAPLTVGAFPVHTVAVERTVKVVTDAARAVVGEEQRHGYICSRLRHRQQLPAVISKKSFM